MHEFLVLNGWRRGPDPVRFGQLPFRMQLTFVAAFIAVGFAFSELGHF